MEDRGVRAGINSYASVWLDRDRKIELAKTPLLTPVLGIGGEHSAGAWVAEGLKRVASHVSGSVVPGARHWLGDEHPRTFADAIHEHLTRA